MTRRRARRLAALAALGLATWLGAGAAGAELAMAPRRRAVRCPEHIAERPIEAVRLTADDGVALAGWWVDAGTERAVALFAGIGGDRGALVERARLWVDRGWSALLIDLRGTGESGGDRITFGWAERLDVIAAFDFLGRRGARELAVHGVSLGAAAIAYAADRIGPRLDRAVLEMPYRDLDSALVNRMPWVPWPELALWPMRTWGGVRIGRTASMLRPIDAIHRLAAPVLVLSGRRDAKARPDEVGDLVANLDGRATIAWFPTAGHENLLRADRARFVTALDGFLAR